MQKLREEMQEHLRLHFNNEEAADEQVKPRLYAYATDHSIAYRVDG